MLISLKLDTLSYKFLKRKNLLNLTCDESKDDYIGTVIFAMFLEFEQERRPLTDLLVRRYDDTYYHSASINISARKLRRTSRREMHYNTIRRANKFIHKQFLFEYLAHMRVTRYKYLEHKEDATYEFLRLYDLDENDVKVESVAPLVEKKTPVRNVE
jgi:hypothetical protein